MYDSGMPPQTPYANDLGDREPIAAIRDSLARIRALAASWSPPQFERSYAPGKWSAREILTHLAHSELAFGTRARMALAAPERDYVAQPFDQDAWMARESALGGRDALDALLGVASMNVALYAALSPADRDAAFSHPEYGGLTVDWLIHQSAGHLIHHLKQLDAIAGG
jgi:DinB family protein